MGEPARKLFVEMSGADQQECLLSMRAFFKKGTEKLMEYLPLQSSVLRACKLLDPRNQTNDRFIHWVVTLAKHLPAVVSETELDSLRVEARLHQQDLQDVDVEDIGLLDFWSKFVFSSKADNRPLLLRIVQVLLVLPHGNAEVERVFSNVSNVVTKKRSSLAPLTVKALVVSRSCLKTKCWSAATLPVSLRLKNMCASAYAAFRQHLQQEKVKEEQEKQKELEKQVIAEVQMEKKASKAYINLEKSMTTTDELIKQKQKEKENADRLLLEMTRSKEDRDRELANLQQQQQKLHEKKMKEAEKIAENVLKRKAIEQGLLQPLPKTVTNKRFRRN